MKLTRLVILLAAFIPLASPALAGMTATPQLYVTPTAVKYGQTVGIYSTITSALGSPAGSVAVKSDGTEISTQVLTSYPVKAISAGTSHTCAIQDSALKCWGENSFGQLGDGSVTSSSVPVSVSSMSGGIKAVAAGATFTCAIQDDSAYCWGDNRKGQLGTGDFVNSSTPMPVVGLGSGVTAIAAGPESACAIQNGALKCWGRNHMMQLGDNTTNNAPSPVNVHNMTSGVSAVSISLGHACAIKSNAAYCWGDNATGQIGDGTNTQRGEPVVVTNLSSGVQLIATGLNHSCAVLASGIRCWGLNANGQLGDASNNSSNAPVNVAFLSTGVTGLALGEFTSCVIANSGVGCWGYGGDGELGDGTTGSSNFPVASGLDTGYAVTALEAGAAQVCAIAGSGAGYCWGKNTAGQLGDGTTTLKSSPVAVDHFQKDSISNYAVSSLAVGTHQIMVAYSGNSAFDPANSATVAVTVAKANTTLALSSSDTATSAGQMVTLKATIAVVSPGAGVPGGLITYKDGVTTIGSANLAGGKASLSTSRLAVGTHSITAIYAGDGNFVNSVSAVLVHEVSKLPVTAKASTSLSRVLPLSPIRIDVTLTATGLTPTGSVTLVENAQTLSTAVLSGGKASFTLAALASGDHSFTVRYAGGANFLPANTGIAVTVSPLSGSSFRLSAFKTGDQSRPAIAALKSGGTVAVWTSAGQDGSGLGIYARVYKADGLPLAGEFRVNTVTAGDQTAPAVATLASGDFVIIWLDRATGVNGQLFDSTGKKKAGQFVVDGTNGKQQIDPAVAPHGTGGFAVTWAALTATSAKSTIMLRFFDKNAKPVVASRRIDVLSAGLAKSPAIAALKGGSIAVVWIEMSAAGKPGKVMMRGYGPTGTALSAAVVASIDAKTVKSGPAIAGLNSGALAICWVSSGQDGSGTGVYGRVFKSGTGSALTAEFAIPAATSGDQTDPSIAAFTTGGFMVAWASGDGSGRGIYARRFLANGKPGDGSVRVNSLTLGEQFEPALAATSDRAMTVLWSSANLDGAGLAVAGQQLKLGAPAPVAH